MSERLKKVENWLALHTPNLVASRNTLYKKREILHDKSSALEALLRARRAEQPNLLISLVRFLIADTSGDIHEDNQRVIDKLELVNGELTKRNERAAKRASRKARV